MRSPHNKHQAPQRWVFFIPHTLHSPFGHLWPIGIRFDYGNPIKHPFPPYPFFTSFMSALTIHRSSPFNFATSYLEEGYSFKGEAYFTGTSMCCYT